MLQHQQHLTGLEEIRTEARRLTERAGHVSKETGYTKERDFLMVAMSIFRRLCSSRCPPDYSVQSKIVQLFTDLGGKRIVERKLKWKSVK